MVTFFCRDNVRSIANNDEWLNHDVVSERIRRFIRGNFLEQLRIGSAVGKHIDKIHNDRRQPIFCIGLILVFDAPPKLGISVIFTYFESGFT